MRSTSVASRYAQIRSALSHMSQVSKNMTAAHTSCTARSSPRRARAPRSRSTKSMSACSSAHDTSGSPAKISTTSMSSVTSNAPLTGWLKTYRATTSTNVRSIMARRMAERSEEHTSELQSRLHLVCRLLLEKKKQDVTQHIIDEEQVLAAPVQPAGLPADPADEDPHAVACAPDSAIAAGEDCAQGSVSQCSP